MGRKTVYNHITTDEVITKILPENIELMDDFLDYLSSLKRSERTLNGYRSDLLIFFAWNLQYNKNKYFVDLTKREVAKFQKHCFDEWKWSTNRLARVKSALSSMSNYIENVLDDEIEDYKPIIRKIETPIKEMVREKTIISDEEVDKVLDELVEKKKYQTACALALAANCGCRISELLEFKVSYFDESNIVFDGALYKTPEQIKTKGRSGGKYLTKYIFVDFKKYFDLWMDERKKRGIESEWLFVKPSTGERAKISTLYSYSETLSKMFEVDFYFHCTRHYLCTKMRKYNLPSNIIQEFFGWTSMDMISIYDDSDASEEFGKYFTKEGIVEAKQASLNNM